MIKKLNKNYFNLSAAEDALIDNMNALIAYFEAKYPDDFKSVEPEQPEEAAPEESTSEEAAPPTEEEAKDDTPSSDQ